MKCGTSTLHAQLAALPGIFMSTPKEPNFFSDDSNYARGLEYYEGLFSEAADGDLKGESSTHYTKLPTHPRTVERLTLHLPDARFVYVIRQPVGRLISQYVHEWSVGNVSSSIEQALDEFPALIDYGRYSMQLRPYLEAFGPERILLVFLESLVTRPDHEFARILSFLGYPGPSRQWDRSLDAQNKGAQRMRRDGWRDTLVYAPGVSQLRARLPQSWRDWVKGAWQMRHPPELRQPTRRKLEFLYDQDLEQLGSWLGTKLDCDSFVDVARTIEPTWRLPLELQAPKGPELQPPEVGIVAIGRNEGERLRRCLESVCGAGHPVVYVDSGSSDGSQALARRLGAEVVELDLTQPFTAARARNAGWKRLCQLHGEPKFVQFVDGDCELQPQWLRVGLDALKADPALTVVFGRRQERHPGASLFNRVIDMEWDVPPGPVRSCHGDALMRAEAFARSGGFDDALIAGEEPELCVRLRREGGSIRCLDAPMTIHDAEMTRLSQFWKRATRAGYAYAEGFHLHGRTGRHRVRETASVLAWGLAYPLALCVLAPASAGKSLWGFAAYPWLAGKVYREKRIAGTERRAAAGYAWLTVIGKFAQVQGALRFALNLSLHRPAVLIEYK